MDTVIALTSSFTQVVNRYVPDILFLAAAIVAFGLYARAWIKNYAHLEDR